MSVGCCRLGLNTALLTAFGEDPVGDFVVHFLTTEGVDIRFSPRKKDRHTSLAVLGIEPPDKFPLVFYRDNCADIALEISDAFGAGFLYGYVKGWDLWKAARLGNACGAMVVTRHGCSISMPHLTEVMSFVDQQGGF